MELPVGTTGGNLTYAQMQQYAAFLPKDLYFGGSPALAPERAPDRATRAAVERLRSAVGKVEQGQLLAWDVVLVVTAALARVGPDANAAQLRAELERMRVTGAAGSYDFATYPQRGLGSASIVVVRWEPAADHWIGVSGAGGGAR
jgi:branched-chain amino acid transport system substrate-binding protein